MRTKYLGSGFVLKKSVSVERAKAEHAALEAARSVSYTHLLANLQPRTIRGSESRGMILMARQGDGKMRFITPAEALVNGAEIG